MQTDEWCSQLFDHVNVYLNLKTKNTNVYTTRYSKTDNMYI